MEAIDKLLKKPLWVNILTGIGAILLALLLFFFSLGWLTGYGKTEKVPNIVGLDVEAAKKNIKALGFDVVIQDSFYVDTSARNGVLRQTPEADEIVKKGRTIYLTINRVLAPQVTMPNLIGFSLKSAETYLKVLGLRMGTISLVADRNKNVIIDQLMEGKPIAPGVKLSSGSVINFLVGDGGSAVGIEVPDFVGMTVDMARARANSLGLMLTISTRVAIQDTASAFVIGQTPSIYSAQLDSLGIPIKNTTIAGGTIEIIIDKVAPVIKHDSLH